MASISRIFFIGARMIFFLLPRSGLRQLFVGAGKDMEKFTVGNRGASDTTAASRDLFAGWDGEDANPNRGDVIRRVRLCFVGEDEQGI